MSSTTEHFATVKQAVSAIGAEDGAPVFVAIETAYDNQAVGQTIYSHANGSKFRLEPIVPAETLKHVTEALAVIEDIVVVADQHRMEIEWFRSQLEEKNHLLEVACERIAVLEGLEQGAKTDGEAWEQIANGYRQLWEATL